jgi:EAL domain-containing protein (putative c-di-GMP-specific phosphodiesterase class I)
MSCDCQPRTQRQLQVVAEGIETAEQLKFVTTLGCDQWQDYLLLSTPIRRALEEYAQKSSSRRLPIPGKYP